MASWSGEEVFEGIEKWLKTRRDEYGPGEYYDAIDNLLNELRDKGAEGWLPWQKP